MNIIIDAAEIDYNPNSPEHWTKTNSIGKALDAHSDDIMRLEATIEALQTRIETMISEENAEKELRKNSKALQSVWEKYQFTKQMVTDPTTKPK